jgi:hypothetical protein
MICVWPRLLYYDIWSSPLGLKLVGAFSARASQKYQISHIEIRQFELQVSPCPCLFLIFLQVCHSFELVRFQQVFDCHYGEGVISLCGG